MCTVCGCGESETNIEAKQHHNHEQEHHHNHEQEHHHHPGHDHIEHIHDHHYGKGPAHAHVAGLSQSRMVQIEEDILSKNNHYATANRDFFREKSILALNLVSSPGSGKTTLLTKTIENLKVDLSLSVIEGDQQTANDAERIRSTGVKAIQINTGKGCHLDAHMVEHALESLRPEKKSVLFIENVGNLVCPAAFDLGEAHKVVILSVTEGEDKPIKYPDMFFAADLMILNKIDLLPYVEFNVDNCIEFARRVNPDIKVIQLSASKGDGMEIWHEWIKANHQLAII